MRIINLLPPAERRNIFLEKINGYLKRFLSFTFFSFLILVVGFIFWRFYIQSTLSNIDNDIKNAEALISSQDNQKTKSEVQRNNNIIKDYNSFAAVNPNWSPVLLAFADLVPKEVSITDFNANTKSGKIDISGVGLTRDAVLLLRENILGSDKFEKINLPLENLQKPTNANFTYTFYLRPGVLSSSVNGATNAN